MKRICSSNCDKRIHFHRARERHYTHQVCPDSALAGACGEGKLCTRQTKVPFAACAACFIALTLAGEAMGRMSAAGPSAVVNNGQFSHKLQHHMQLQQLLLNASANVAPLHAIQQQQNRAFDAKQLAANQSNAKQGCDAATPSAAAQHAQHAAERPMQGGHDVVPMTAVTGAVVPTQAQSGPLHQQYQPFEQEAAVTPPVAALPPAVKALHAARMDMAGEQSPVPHSPTTTTVKAAHMSPTPDICTGMEQAKRSSTSPTCTEAAADADRFSVLAPSPLAPPDEAEGPEATAEYARYLERWKQGDTLAQRWHRLSRQGVLCDIVEEWEEWQHDLLLQELQANNKLLARHTRKHMREEQDVDTEAPRQTRTRRVPTALQDYQVGMVATGTPEPQGHTNGITSADAPAATGGTKSVPSSRAAAQQGDGGGGVMEVLGTEPAVVIHNSRPARGAPAAAKVGRGSAASGIKPYAGYSHPAAGPMNQYHPHMQQQHFTVDSFYQHMPGGLTAALEGSVLAQQQQQHPGVGQKDTSSVPHQTRSDQHVSAGLTQLWMLQQQQQAAMGSTLHGRPTLQKGYPHTTTLAPAAVSGLGSDLVAHLLHASAGGASSVSNNNTGTQQQQQHTVDTHAAAMSVPGLHAAAGLFPGADVQAAVQTFTQVMGHWDPVLFAKSFGPAMLQQQQQQHLQR